MGLEEGTKVGLDVGNSEGTGVGLKVFVIKGAIGLPDGIEEGTDVIGASVGRVVG